MGKIMQINYGSATAGSNAKAVASAFSSDGARCKKVPQHLEQAARLISNISQINSAKESLIIVNKIADDCVNAMNHFAVSYDLFMRIALSKELLVSSSFKDASEFTTTEEGRKSFASIFAAAFKEYPIEKARLSIGLSVEELERMIKNGDRIDTAGWEKRISYTNMNGTPMGFYKNTDGCTWYALARFNQVNGKDKELKFSKGGGWAGIWHEYIDKSVFTCTKTKADTIIRPNSIAVSDKYSQGDRASGNHVAYIEAVTDEYVYYTDGSANAAQSTYGYVIKVKKDVFLKEYEHIITAK